MNGTSTDSSVPMKSTYAVVRLCAIPTIQPPITAPKGLSKPPRQTAASA